MPIVKFFGLEAEDEVIRRMIRQIKIWVSSVKSLKVKPGNVTPVYFSVIQENPGECVVFEIPELFTVSFEGATRTPSMKKALCKAIKKGFLAFVLKEHFKVKPKRVVVIIHMVDRKKGEYDHGDVPLLPKSPLDPDKLGRWKFLLPPKKEDS